MTEMGAKPPILWSPDMWPLRPQKPDLGGPDSKVREGSGSGGGIGSMGAMGKAPRAMPAAWAAEPAHRGGAASDPDDAYGSYACGPGPG